VTVEHNWSRNPFFVRTRPSDAMPCMLSRPMYYPSITPFPETAYVKENRTNAFANDIQQYFHTYNLTRERTSSTLSDTTSIFLLIMSRRSPRPTRPPRNVLPRSSEPPSRTSQKPLFLVLFGILIHLVLIQFRRAEQRCDEHG